MLDVNLNEHAEAWNLQCRVYRNVQEISGMLPQSKTAVRWSCSCDGINAIRL